jgi:hypothetical protein
MSYRGGSAVQVMADPQRQIVNGRSDTSKKGRFLIGS